jgi:hypothetical protein
MLSPFSGAAHSIACHFRPAAVTSACALADRWELSWSLVPGLSPGLCARICDLAHFRSGAPAPASVFSCLHSSKPPFCCACVRGSSAISFAVLLTLCSPTAISWTMLPSSWMVSHLPGPRPVVVCLTRLARYGAVYESSVSAEGKKVGR